MLVFVVNASTDIVPVRIIEKLGDISASNKAFLFERNSFRFTLVNDFKFTLLDPLAVIFNGKPATVGTIMDPSKNKDDFSKLNLLFSNVRPKRFIGFFKTLLNFIGIPENDSNFTSFPKYLRYKNPFGLLIFT